MNDDRPPICPRCGVTMVPAELSARDSPVNEWICLECEETADPEETERSFARSNLLCVPRPRRLT
jgi:hypothetical protein